MVLLPSFGFRNAGLFFGCFTLMVLGLLRGQGPRFEAGVTNVCVKIAVRHQGGNILGLQQTDFIVLEEGVPQKVVGFSEDRSPLDLVLLLDVSGSMVRDIREMARNAAAALEQIRDGDRVAVVAFSVETFLIQPFTADRAAIAAAIRRVANRGSIDFAGTEINSSIADCLRLLRSQLSREQPSFNIERSKAILIVTDNMPDGPPAPDDIIIRELLAADTTLHSIVIHRSHFGSKLNFPPRTHPTAAPGYTNQNVFHIALETGGEAILSTTGPQVRNALSEMLTRLRQRYSIWYQAPRAPAGLFRQISVQLNEAAQKVYPAAEVRARYGYYTR